MIAIAPREIKILPFDSFDQPLLCLRNNSLQDLAEDMNGTLFSHSIYVQLFEEGAVPRHLVLDDYFKFADCFESTLQPFAFLLVRSVKIQTLGPNIRRQIAEAVDA